MKTTLLLVAASALPPLASAAADQTCAGLCKDEFVAICKSSCDATPAGYEAICAQATCSGTSCRDGVDCGEAGGPNIMPEDRAGSDDGHEHDDMPGGGGMGESDASSMNQFEALNVDDMFEGKYDPEKAYEFYDELMNDAVGTHGAAQTFCKVGLSTKMGGNMMEMMMQGEDGKDMKKALSEIHDVIKPVKVPCGSMLDMSAGIIEAAGAMGFDPNSKTTKEDIDFKCTGPSCKCAALQVKTGISLQLDFDKILEQQPMLKQMGIKSMKDLLKMMDTPEAMQQMAGDMTEKQLADQKKMMKLASDGLKFSNTLSMFACVNADAPTQKDKIYEFDAPGFSGMDMGVLTESGMVMTAETTAAMTVIDAPKPLEPKKDEKFLYTKADGTTMEVTIKKVNTEATTVSAKGTDSGPEKNIEIPAGQSVVVTTPAGVEITLATAALTNAEEEAVLQAPAAPENKIANAVDDDGNAASTTSTGLFATAAALISVVTLTR